VGLKFHRSARRHRVGIRRQRFVIGSTTPVRVPGGSREGLDLLSWVGLDPRGEELEITAVDYGNGDLGVFHAMATKYRTKA